MPPPEPLPPKSSIVFRTRTEYSKLQSAWTVGPKLSAPASGAEEQLTVDITEEKGEESTIPY